MNSRTNRRLITAGLFTILISFPSIWFARHYHQAKLDRALIAEIKRDDVGAVDALLARGADPNTRDSPQKRQTFVQILKELIHPTADHSATAMMVGLGYELPDPIISERAPQIVKTLLHYGADANAISGDGFTALIVAANTADTDTVKALIAAGADINHKDKYGDTALISAVNGYNTSTLNALIAAGSDVNTTDIKGDTALFAAAMLGDRIDMIKALIAAGTDIDQKDKQGQTALMYAVTYGQIDIACAYISAGANVNLKDGKGKTSLDIAAWRKRLDIASILRKAGAK